MSEIINRVNSSPIPRGVPRQGSTMTVASPEADIAALLEQITATDPTDGVTDATEDNYDSVDDPDTIDDLDAIVDSLPAEISAPGSKSDTPKIEAPQTETPADTTDDSDDLVDSDDSSSEDLADGGANFKKYIVAGAVIIAIITLAVVLSKAFEGSDKQPEPSTSTATISGSQSTFYADQLTSTDTTTYQDSMIIEKYIVLDQDACLFVFKGYAENARAFVTAYVDIDTYNRYKTGARVPVLYERLSVNGADYYMKVRVNT